MIDYSPKYWISDLSCSVHWPPPGGRRLNICRMRRLWIIRSSSFLPLRLIFIPPLFCSAENRMLCCIIARRVSPDCFFLPQFFFYPSHVLICLYSTTFFSVLSLTSGAGQYELPTKYKWSTFLPNGQTEKHLFTSKNWPLLLFSKFFGDENEKKKTFTKRLFSVFSSSCVCGNTEGC